jgi:hypothetical protein
MHLHYIFVTGDGNLSKSKLNRRLFETYSSVQSEPSGRAVLVRA